MNAESSEDEYGKKKYDSYESDEEEDINPFGGTINAYENEFRKKERIERRGRIPLNMTRNYGRKSGWGVREGIRELIQNLYVFNKEYD